MAGSMCGLATHPFNLQYPLISPPFSHSSTYYHSTPSPPPLHTITPLPPTPHHHPPPHSIPSLPPPLHTITPPLPHYHPLHSTPSPPPLHTITPLLPPSPPHSTPQAFSHFTFERSGHQLIVVDIQGVGDLWTDPQIHSTEDIFGEGNLGCKGMALFFHSHHCNPICASLGLSPFDLAANEVNDIVNCKASKVGFDG